jgi:serine/threonine protein kinase
LLSIETMAWQEGELIKEGKYEIKKKLGQGGYGTVYLASDRSARDVAIKTLHEHLRENEDYERFEQDFMNEARRLAGFSHLPFIVSIYEVIKEGDIWGIVMEYVDGKNLDHLGVISEKLALLYIQQISSALSEVHEKGLLHRDIKPNNILVRTKTNEAILVDFGIAREFTAKIIQTQTPFCSDFYAAPEQYNQRTERSASSDIYSLAATLYKILTGKEPEGAISRSLYGCELKSPKQLNPSISDVVEAGILKGLELQANNRPQSIKEWLEIMDLKIITPSEYGDMQDTLSIKDTEESINKEQKEYRIERRVEFYIMELTDLENEFRYKAILELSRLKQKALPAVPCLIQIMGNINDPLSSQAHVENILSEIGAASVIPLSQLLSHNKIAVRRRSSRTLARIGKESSAAIPQLIVAMEDSDNEVVWYSVFAIGKIGKPAKDAISILIKRLNNVEAGIRAYAAYALGRMGIYAQASISEIIKMLNKETNENVILAALEAIEALGHNITTMYFEHNSVKKRNAKKYVTIQRKKLSKEFARKRSRYKFYSPLNTYIPAQTDSL